MSPRALVVEDDPDQLHIVSSVLAKMGITVVQASSGGQLLDRLAHAGPFDVIVTDISMPSMTGVQAIQLARSVGVAAPVVVMTALRDTSLADQIAALGPAVLIHKPFTLATLTATVTRALSGDTTDSARLSG